jgi:hypothetical protein
MTALAYLDDEALISLASKTRMDAGSPSERVLPIRLRRGAISGVYNQVFDVTTGSPPCLKTP